MRVIRERDFYYHERGSIFVYAYMLTPVQKCARPSVNVFVVCFQSLLPSQVHITVCQKIAYFKMHFFCPISVVVVVIPSNSHDAEPLVAAQTISARATVGG